MSKIKLYHGDCLDVLPTIGRASVNLVVTSPPYNVGLDYASYEDDKPFEEYMEFLTKVCGELYEVLAEDGRIAINIGDGKNGKIPTHSILQMKLLELGYKPMTLIVWDKKTTSNRAAWGSFMSPSCPSFPSPMEYVLVLSKTNKLTHKGTSTITKENFIQWTNPIWDIKPETRLNKIGHPAAFPIELPRRLIEILSYKEDVVLDPFMGSGSTGVSCVATNRAFIGIDKDEKYFKIAQERISKACTTPQQQELF